VQIGRRPAVELGEIERACLPAYVDGLRDEGCEVPLDVVRRAHALQMLVFSGFSSFMLDEVLGSSGEGAAPAPGLLERAAERARITEFVLDLVDETEALATRLPG